MRAANEEIKREASQNEYLEMTVPYHFSSLARSLGQNLKIGDAVRLAGLADKYELVGIYRRRNSVRVKAVGRTDQMYLPWWHIRPWKEETEK
jgi:hypothetical protein